MNDLVELTVERRLPLTKLDNTLSSEGLSRRGHRPSLDHSKYMIKDIIIHKQLAYFVSENGSG